MGSCVLLLLLLLQKCHAKPVKKWKLLAGWPVGKNELDGDPVEAFGSVFALHNVSRSTFPAMHSELLDSEVRWRSLASTDNQEGWTVASLAADWNALVNGLSSMEVAEWQGWAVGSFKAKTHGAAFRFQCDGVRTFHIDRRIPTYAGICFRQAA